MRLCCFPRSAITNFTNVMDYNGNSFSKPNI